MGFDQIYIKIVTENNCSKCNKRELKNPTAVIRGVNLICGNGISLQIRGKDGTIEDTSFIGIGCAILQASASITIDLTKRKTEEEAVHLAETFLSMIKGGRLGEEAQDGLKDTAAFQNISKLPMHVECAVLAWHILEEAIQSDRNCPDDDPASCETRI